MPNDTNFGGEPLDDLPEGEPADATDARERRIRERAYHLWEADGRPPDRDLEYWARASDLEDSASGSGAGLLSIEPNEPEQSTGAASARGAIASDVA